MFDNNGIKQRADDDSQKCVNNNPPERMTEEEIRKSLAMRELEYIMFLEDEE